MTEIPITDSLSLTADLKLSDESSLSKSKLNHLNFLSAPLIGDLDKPLDHLKEKEFSFGAELQFPSTLLNDGAKLTLKTGICGSMALVGNSAGDLFGNDPFSPRIAIASGECWLKVELQTTLEGKISGKVDGIGLAVDHISTAAFATYSLARRTGDSFPTLRTALETAFENFSVTSGAQAIRAQKPGTVNVTGTGGSVKFAASYSLPLSVAALASADLPFSYKLQLQPANKVTIGGELALTGDFTVRCHKVTADKLELGLYKKQGIAVKASFTAGTDIGIDVSNQDVLGALLGAVLPGVKANLPDVELRSVLKECVDHQLAVSVNAQFTDGFADEAAVVYALDLSAGNELETNAALSSALRGDWTLLARLPNARRVRNVFEHTRETRHKLRINLLGIYNAESLDAFTRTCTILRDDETGQLTITDKIKATEISVAARPLASDSKKLKSALAEAYLATATYAASNRFTLTVSQTYMRFASTMSKADMHKEMLLARALGQAQPELTQSSYKRARIEASTEYGTDGAKQIFAERAVDELESVGRRVLAQLLDPTDPTDAQRIDWLKNDAAWKAMNQNGNEANFGRLPELRGLPLNLVQDLAANWMDITGWAKAVNRVAPALRDVLNATEDNLEQRHRTLAGTLASVAKNCRAAFAEGWGLAVASELIGSTGLRKFDAVWDGNSSAPATTSAT